MSQSKFAMIFAWIATIIAIVALTLSMVTLIYRVTVPKSTAIKKELEIVKREIPITDEFLVDELDFTSAITLGGVTIYNTGEVKYSDSLSEHAKAFWGAVIAAYPDAQWRPIPNEWYHVVYKTNLGQPIVTNIEFPSSDALMEWLHSIEATSWQISEMGARPVP